MRFSPRTAGYCLLGIFALSGFAGLIYQSIWSHYLGLTLGHAAYAQTLVLAIFMGGMALGAGLASRWMPKLRHLVLAYAAVEGVIGLAGLIFHPLFLAATAVSQDTILPSLSSEGVARAYQWGLATLLIAPQSILLGATFPLLSGAFLRISPKDDTGILGGLYFTNSIGAAFGALFSTFVLLPWIGMPGAVATAGIINLAVALFAWGVWALLPEKGGDVATASAAAATPSKEVRRLDRILLIAAFITGATSFFYEVSWVRMLNMALGTTVHSFELMLAAFILGLAMGGLWIRRYGARIQDVVAYSGYAQIFMGVAAMASLLAFAHSFSGVAWMMSALARSESGYTLFSAGGAAVALFVMFPAAFFAGMTLPLFTTALLRRGAGEKSIGRIYSANTLGAIVGVALVVHVFIPTVGLRISTWVAALADIGLGLYLLRMVSPGRPTPGIAVSLLVALVAAGGAMLFGRADPGDLASGVYRNGARGSGEYPVVYLRDGKTATVSVKVGKTDGLRSIATNGKPDAAVAGNAADAPALDEWTMSMAGALPLVEHPDPKHVAVIGWGSGLTVHTLLGSSVPERVDVIEIEPAMHDGARLFGERVKRAYDDPRSQVHFEDARTYFATGNRKFDVVISEPSNPWVSGVASLFTREFYGFVSRHLNEGGVLVQWIHTYELSDDLLATMVSALVEEFPHVEAYSASLNDLILVARLTPRGESARDWNRLREGELGRELTRLGLIDASDFAVRYLGNESVLRTFVEVRGAGPHSDFYPVVSLQGPKARFMDRTADSLYTLVMSGLPVLEMLGDRVPVATISPAASTESNRFVVAHQDARMIRDALRAGQVTSALRNRASVTAAGITNLLQMSSTPIGPDTLRLWSAAASAASGASLGHLSAEELAGAWIDPAWIDRANGHHPAVPWILDAMAAAARRDAAAMQTTALEALKLGEDGLASPMRERLLVIAMLGAYGTGGTKAMVELHDAHGRSIPTGEFAFVRAFLLRWKGPGDEAMALL